MSELVEWLRAQLAEDARVAIGVGQDESELCWNVSYDGAVRDRDLYIVAQCEPELGHEVQTHIARHDPARVLREVAAKRAIVDRYAEHAEYDDPEDPYEYATGRIVGLGEALRLLASAYSDRPGYREEWAP